ncbi:hypothetical protein BCV70DRAFT_207325 [Testicularia cyperi]|uniref:SNF2 N-terminal domain-containing protein n=1 Tax=Testicularia cyperi TaxID=1882483 RepID=A0A317XLD0_9BASI|nr:hypothetical protein BCV70DRAFT_207325 [Testicularia cyperi]
MIAKDTLPWQGPIDNPLAGFYCQKYPGKIRAVVLDTAVQEALDKMYDGIGNGRELLPTKASKHIKTCLLPHQELALTFLLEQESDCNWRDLKNKVSSQQNMESLVETVSLPMSLKQATLSLHTVVLDRQGKIQAYQNIITKRNTYQAPKICQGSILANDMGLGKTLSTILLIAYMQELAQCFEALPWQLNIQGVWEDKVHLMMNALLKRGQDKGSEPMMQKERASKKPIRRTMCAALRKVLWKALNGAKLSLTKPMSSKIQRLCNPEQLTAFLLNVDYVSQLNTSRPFPLPDVVCAPLKQAPLLLQATVPLLWYPDPWGHSNTQDASHSLQDFALAGTKWHGAASGNNTEKSARLAKSSSFKNKGKQQATEQVFDTYAHTSDITKVERAQITGDLELSKEDSQAHDGLLVRSLKRINCSRVCPSNLKLMQPQRQPNDSCIPDQKAFCLNGVLGRLSKRICMLFPGMDSVATFATEQDCPDFPGSTKVLMTSAGTRVQLKMSYSGKAKVLDHVTGCYSKGLQQQVQSFVGELFPFETTCKVGPC